MKLFIAAAALGMVLALAPALFADETAVPLNLITDQGIGKAIGSITLIDTPQGLKLAPALTDLAPGVHGFHVHDKPDCGPGMKDGKPAAGFAAGGHYDPMASGKHEGPMGKGHLGDLPALVVDKDGKATAPVVAPRLKLSDLKGRSIMIHAGGDNYADAPAPLGGGGGRVACGVIK